MNKNYPRSSSQILNKIVLKFEEKIRVVSHILVKSNMTNMKLH